MGGTGSPARSGPSDTDLVGRLEVFVDQWRNFRGTEQAGAQQFLQGLLDAYEATFKPGTVFEQHPVLVPKVKQQSLFADDAPTKYTTERMDMYLPKVCVWEMKAPSETDLEKHHPQLLGYWARVRTRYMVLCNFHEFWIYDTNDDDGQLAPKVKLPLVELPGRNGTLAFLRGEEADLAGRSERVTSEVAAMLGRLVRQKIEKSADPARERERISKFVLQCVFAMFAEDTDLVPAMMFTTVLKNAASEGRLDGVWTLFDDFARKNAKEKRHPFAPYVDGPLFDRTPSKLTLTADEIQALHAAARDFDWQDVRPEVFGSIFEQALDPVERHELGAHFTREDDIARVVIPTVIKPWQDRIAAVRTPKDAERAVAEMKAFHVLDPACGCGNFLYVVYREMKRLEAALARRWVEVERRVAKRRADIRPPPPGPYFTIQQLHGIEINPFAAFLARVVLWIGEHLAKRELGLDEETLPLKPLDLNVRHADALEIEWPRPDGELAIVGNPPYLGVRKLRRELGDEYVERLFTRYPGNRAADYVTYWFTRALEVLRSGERAGYVCTNSVAQNESREASIDLILGRGGTITDAWKSYPWPGEAAVHIGIVNWVMAPYEGVLLLDGAEVHSISAGLTAATDVATARHLRANEGLCFMGVTPGNAGFVLTGEERQAVLADDRDSDKVIRPFLVGRDVNRELDQRPTRWIIDFASSTKSEAESHRGAFRHVQRHVYGAKRDKSDRKTVAEKERWWQFVRPRPDLREAVRSLRHALVIPCVSPHLTVSRQSARICFDHQLMVIALEDYYHLGLLQSALHEVWAWARGSTHEERLRYTNTTIFETFPFPLLPDGTYDPRRVARTPNTAAVADAAKEFDRLRVATCRDRELGLTKIHNELKAGKLDELGAAYDALNDAVTACYGFPAGSWRDEGETLRLLLELNERIARTS